MSRAAEVGSVLDYKFKADGLCTARRQLQELHLTVNDRQSAPGPADVCRQLAVLTSLTCLRLVFSSYAVDPEGALLPLLLLGEMS